MYLLDLVNLRAYVMFKKEFRVLGVYIVEIRGESSIHDSSFILDTVIDTFYDD